VSKTHNYFFGQWPEMPWKQENKMGKEILAIPEEDLAEVIRIIREGLDHLITQHQLFYNDRVVIMLNEWCDEMEDE